MKVLHVIAHIAPRYGGPAMAIGPMLTALHASGVEVQLATTDADGPDGRLSESKLTAAAYPRHLLPGPNESPSALIEWVRANAVRYDLIHTHGLWNRPTTVAMAAAHKADIPYVVRTCGMLAPYSWNRRWWKKRPYWWLFDRRKLRRASAIHVTSPGERAEVAAWGLPPPIHEIPLGLDADAFSARGHGDLLRTRCGSDVGHRPIVFFLGRLHPVKGITDLLLPAFCRLKSDAFLAIAGGRDETVPGYEAEIRATVDRLGLSKDVALLGPIKGRDKWACFDGAALTVQPSHTENFGLSVAEALARGCPVVVTEGVQSRSVVEASGGGWVVPFDPTRLAATLDAAFADPAGTAARGRAGHDFVKRELAWDRIAAKLVAMYRSVTP